MVPSKWVCNESYLESTYFGRVGGVLEECGPLGVIEGCVRSLPIGTKGGDLGLGSEAFLI